MPKRKNVSQEELGQAAAGLSEQMETDAAAPLETPPEARIPDDGPPMEGQETEASAALPDDPGEVIGNAPEAMEVGMATPSEVPGDASGDDPAESLSPGDEQPAGEQEVAEELPPSREPAAGERPPLTDRQSFFSMDFRELDRDLTPEERQAWNSIYASFRGRSALSGKIIGAAPHSMNVRNKESGKVERRTMYCVVVLLYRVPVYIPATEMWTGEARPDYVLQNMMGADINCTGP